MEPPLHVGAPRTLIAEFEAGRFSEIVPDGMEAECLCCLFGVPPLCHRLRQATRRRRDGEARFIAFVGTESERVSGLPLGRAGVGSLGG